MTLSQLLDCTPRYVDILFHTDDDQIKGRWSAEELKNLPIQTAEILSITPIGPYTMIVEATTQTTDIAK